MRFSGFFFWVIVMCVSVSPVFAETVNGQVVDAQTNRGLGNMVVSIGDASARTDSNGYFTMWLEPGRYSNVHIRGRLPGRNVNQTINRTILIRSGQNDPITIQI